MQFGFWRRQSFSAEFADAIFQSAVHGAQWARVQLDSHVPKWLFDAIHVFLATKQPVLDHAPKMLSCLGNFFLQVFPNKSAARS
jgi:hypothetical protein